MQRACTNSKFAYLIIPKCLYPASKLTPHRLHLHQGSFEAVQ